MLRQAKYHFAEQKIYKLRKSSKKHPTKKELELLLAPKATELSKSLKEEHLSGVADKFTNWQGLIADIIDKVKSSLVLSKADHNQSEVDSPATIAVEDG